MIVWINGTFGVGKTTTAQAVRDATGWRLFDPEHVGYFLAGHFRDQEIADFQDLPPWRALVPAVAEEILRHTGHDAMLAVQTVLVEDYWRELAAGFAGRGIPVHHVVLDCAEAELRRRIETDEIETQARQWRLDHLTHYAEAQRWLATAADLVIDTSSLSVAEVAAAVTDGATRHLATPD
ncbi:MAG: AAA family ATPase [Actinomycetota bacterium]